MASTCAVCRTSFLSILSYCRVNPFKPDLLSLLMSGCIPYRICFRIPVLLFGGSLFGVIMPLVNTTLQFALVETMPGILEV